MRKIQIFTIGFFFVACNHAVETTKRTRQIAPEYADSTEARDTIIPCLDRKAISYLQKYSTVSDGVEINRDSLTTSCYMDSLFKGVNGKFTIQYFQDMSAVHLYYIKIYSSSRIVGALISTKFDKVVDSKLWEIEFKRNASKSEYFKQIKFTNSDRNRFEIDFYKPVFNGEMIPHGAISPKKREIYRIDERGDFVKVK